MRPGVAELFDDCARAGMRMGIVTTTSAANVAADTLSLRPDEALAIEDAPAGVTAARAAGVAVVVVRSFYFAAAEVEGALAVGPSLGRAQGWDPPGLSEPCRRLRGWRFARHRALSAAALPARRAA